MRELSALPPGDPGSDPTLPAARAAAWAAAAAEVVDADADIEPADDSTKARRELLESLDASITDPTAFVLPLSRSENKTAWQSARWTTRRGRLVLTPGTSPAGLRLPLNSLSWGPAPVLYEADPSVRADPLPDDVADSLGRTVTDVDPTAFVPRTALVAEKRGDTLYVFLPPTAELEEYLAIVEMIENAAAEIDTPVVIEGYGAPADARLVTLTVTPDPGVIEVNVQPTSSFAEQTELLDSLLSLIHI